MCVEVRAVCVCARAHACMCTYRGQRRTEVSCSIAPHLVPLRSSLSLNLELAISDRLLASQLQNFYLHHQLWYYRDV